MWHKKLHIVSRIIESTFYFDISVQNLLKSILKFLEFIENNAK